MVSDVILQTLENYLEQLLFCSNFWSKTWNQKCPLSLPHLHLHLTLLFWKLKHFFYFVCILQAFKFLFILKRNKKKFKGIFNKNEALMHIHLSFIRNMRLSTTPYIWRTTFSIINIINNADKYLAFKYVFQLCLDNPTLSLTHAFLMKLEWICIKLHTWQVFFFSLILLWVKICNGFKKLGKKSSCISNTSRKFHFKSINVHDDDELKNGMVDQQKYASFDQRQRSSS